MKSALLSPRISVEKYIFITITLAIIVGIFVLNPLWEKFSPPFPTERIFPAITAPVDGPFYLHNAENGYQWKTKDPLSLWFHPLLSAIIRFLPNWLPINLWFWVISILFGIGSLFLTWSIAKLYCNNITPYFFPLILIAPGGLSLATGNAEVPTLLFNTALLLSIIRWKKRWLIIPFALLSILTKPNALYMIPILFVYAISGKVNKDNELWKNSLLGLVTILLGWLSWIIFVDFQTGELGSYFDARILSSKYVAGNPINFFVELVVSFVYTGDIREKIRYSTALIIPIANFWIIGKAPISNVVDRYALASGNLAMLVISLLLGNPNKIIVYTTTLPGYFAIYPIIFQHILNKNWLRNPMNKLGILPVFVLFCLFLLFVYIMGTPLGWYY